MKFHISNPLVNRAPVTICVFNAIENAINFDFWIYLGQSNFNNANVRLITLFRHEMAAIGIENLKHVNIMCISFR